MNDFCSWARGSGLGAAAVWVSIFAGSLGSALAQDPPPAFELLEGDRVVFVGDTLIEREPTYGHWEYVLTTQFPDRHVTFRNLGWSADLPNGRSRVSFDWSKPAEEWFQSLVSQLRSVQPTVVFLGYGMAASFAGEAGLPEFKQWMQRLVEEIRSINSKTRLVILSPIRHEALGGPWPDPMRHNQQLALYTQALRELAEKEKARFVSLFDRLKSDEFGSQAPPLTDNGIHLNEYGYRRGAEVLAQELGWLPSTWRLGVTVEGKQREGSYGVKVVEIARLESRVRVVMVEESLALPPAGEGTNAPPLATPECRMQFQGLPPGDYQLKVDGRALLKRPAADFSSRSVAVTAGPSFDQALELLATLRKKNELFFHRWRPQNSTYLFLFRKHEQGQNAREIPMFDPLIEAEEKRIASLRKPVQHVYELEPAGPSKPEVAPAPSPASATPPPEMLAQPLPDFEIDPALEVRLWAQNPLLAKPIQMNFDPKGRLWVVSSSVYPQIRPGQAAEDKLLILEDTDQDGQADRSTVFADGLLVPTGVEPGDGGAYVGQSTELLHFTDTDGDGKADRRRIVLSGFGTEDTHHIVHTLRWGYDGQLYMNQSIYIHTHLETPHGVVRLNSGGILSLRPDTLEVGIFMKGLVNSWGHHFDRYGQSFATDGAGTPEAGLSGITYVVPGGMYHTYAGARRILGSVSPGSYPKFCGLEFLHSPAFPEAWQGNLLTCDFRAHRIARFALEESGSAYVASEQPLFLRSTNVTFRPVDVKIGPDGALYIADWSNPIIQHGEVDFRDPRRDRVHGRIWRVSARGRPLEKPARIAMASHLKLMDYLVSTNGDTRKQARRLVAERGSAVELPLKLWLEQQTNDQARLEGLWAYQTLHKVQPLLLGALLESPDHRVRAAAVRVLVAWRSQLEDPLGLLSRRVADPHPRVRLEAVRALGQLDSTRAAELALSVLDRPMDKHLDYALWLTMNDLAQPWIGAVQSGLWKTEGREKQLAFGLDAIEPELAGRFLGQWLETHSLDKDGSGPWLELVGRAGGVPELDRVWAGVLGGAFSVEGSVRALAALNHAARVRQLKPAERREQIARLWSASEEPLRLEAVRLTGSWKQGGAVVEQLLAMTTAEQTSAALRQAALDSLRDIGGLRVVEGLLPLCAQGRDLKLRQQAVLVLMGLDVRRATPLAVEVLSDVPQEDQALALWRDLLRFKGAGAQLSKALPATGFSPVAAKAGLRASREGGRNEPELILALSRGANLDSQTPELTAEEMRQLAGRVQQGGEAGRGEAVYRRAELACTTCHAIGGVGGKVGPDLTSIGASAPVDYLIESLLYPNRKIKEGYHSIVLETKDGEEFSGILVRETGTELFVRDASNREVAVAKNNIARRAAGNSLMPSGLMEALPPQDQLDLIRFLSELGKPGPYDGTRGNVARFWRLTPATLDVAQFGDDKVLRSDVLGADWMSAASFVDGRLPGSALQQALGWKAWRGPKSVYAAARFQTAREGKVHLALDVPPGTPAWVNGRALEGETSREAELPAGVHTLVVKVPVEKLPEHVRATVDAGTFLVE